ncbi:hypothetical protein AeRB84_020676, partial [Aphanomyces euteiches]
MNSATNAAALELEMEIAEAITYQKSAAVQPENTRLAYTSKQNEFLQWCRSKGFTGHNALTVSGPKLHLFLCQCVVGRERKARCARGQKQVVGFSTLKQYVNAIVRLWRSQCQEKANSNVHPRTDAVKELLKQAQYTEDERKKANFEDRGIGTPLDGYTTAEQMQKISNRFWNEKRDHGTHLRNWLAFTMAHYCLLRGESVRLLELADLQSQPLEGEGFSPCTALVVVLRQGKTNQHGRIEIGGCIRSKMVDICPHSSLALYLFWRWHVESEEFPSFEKSAHWFGIKVLRSGDDATKEVSYNVHRKAIAAALASAGLNSRAKTHIGRGSGARMAELGGASESQIRRLGHWNNQALENCYLTTLPRKAMRALAGFGPEKGSFYLLRSKAIPCSNLQSKIFPWADFWLDKLKNGEAEATIAAGGFLNLDSVILKKMRPKHPIWQHEVFQSSLYIEFERTMSHILESCVDPSEMQLAQAMPLLAKKVDAVHSDLSSSINSLSNE